jgi:serine/threonine-protein kinase
MNRLADEARALSALNHPNIRMIYEVGSGSAQNSLYHFIATEYVDGENLLVHLNRRRFGLAEILDVLLQTATGLAAAHAAGVLHRDLQPENIVLRADGYVKIIDFGLAKLLEQDSMMIELGAGLRKPFPVTEPIDQPESLEEESIIEPVAVDPYRTRPLDSSALEERGRYFPTPSGTAEIWWAPGTTGYLSPEQIRGEPIDERADLFSLGVIAYHLCAGRLPFEGRTANSILDSILRSQPAPLSKFAPDAPEELEWIIFKALSKEREDRYQTAREMIADITRLKQRLDFESERERRSPTGQLGRPRVSGKLRVPPTTPDAAPARSVRAPALRALSAARSIR